MEKITSLKDVRIQSARSLNSRNGRISSGKFLIEGSEAIDWAIGAGVRLDCIFVVPGQKIINDGYSSCDIYEITDGLMKKITDTNYVVQCVAVGNIQKIVPQMDFCVVLDNLNDFGNIGTIIRTCHAFGINNVISTRADFDLFQKKTIDASRGRVFATALKTFGNPDDTLKYLKEKGFQIVTTSPRGSRLQSLISLSERPVALVVGNETTGASDELMKNADMTVQIPMYGEVESLNVGVATGISIYELKLKKIMGMIEKQIKSTLGRDLNVAAMLIREALDAELKKVSMLSSTQLIFMMVLKCDTVMSLTDAQKQFGITDGETEANFRPLLEKGLINTDESDNFIMTETGLETIGKLWTTVENTENKILEDFTESEKKELKMFLDRIKEKCAKIKEM